MTLPAPGRDAFAVFRAVEARWADNDLYGHLNNARYYEFFDTAVNVWAIEAGILDPVAGTAVNLVVRTECSYFAPLAFPEPLETALALERLGTSSVTFRVGLFGRGAASAAAAGLFTHVHVGRRDRRARPFDAASRAAFETLRTG